MDILVSLYITRVTKCLWCKNLRNSYMKTKLVFFVGFGPMLFIYRWLCFRHFHVIRFSVFVFDVTHYLFQHLFLFKCFKIYSQMIIICMYWDPNSFRQWLTGCIYFQQIKRHHNNIQDVKWFPYPRVQFNIRKW